MPLMSRTGGITAGLFAGDVEPNGWQNGDLWVDTSKNPYPVFVNNLGVAKNIGVVVGGSVSLPLEVAIGA